MSKLAKIGITAALVAAAPFALAQTSSTTDTGSSTLPGTPNTGAGGDSAQNALLLTISGLAALGGLAYLASRRVQA